MLGCFIVHMLPLLLLLVLAERQSIRNTIKSSQSEKFYAARQSSTKKWRKKLPARKKKGKNFANSKVCWRPRRGAIADDDYLMGRRNRTTKALAQTTLFATLAPPSLCCPSLTLVTHMQRRLRVCLKRGLRTFNNAQSDFSRIINLTRVRRAHT